MHGGKTKEGREKNTDLQKADCAFYLTATALKTCKNSVTNKYLSPIKFSLTIACFKQIIFLTNPMEKQKKSL
jgi:hypothetical protein